MDGYRAATRRPAMRRGDPDLGDDQEIGVFTADRYFSGAVDAAEDNNALWCDRSSSSLSSAFKTGGVQDWSAPTLTAATSSSEASWNSRSVLLPPNPPVAAVPAAVESKKAYSEESVHAGGKPSSSSLLLRWLLGVAGCAYPGGGVGESVSTDEFRDEVDASGNVHGGKKRSTQADAMLPGRTRREPADEEPEVTTAKVRPGKWDDNGDGDAFHTGTATLPPLQIVEPWHLRGANPGELSIMGLNPTADERRQKSSDMFHPAGQGISTLAPAPTRQQINSAFTIVAGSTARDGVANPTRASIPHDSGVDYDDDDDASAELKCMYPPSEASVAWSVVTAEGTASVANFSSAASGHYHYYDYQNDGDVAAAKSNRRSRRSRGNGNGLLMGCVPGRAVDAIGPARSVHRPVVEPGAAAGSRRPGSRGAATWHSAGRK